MHKNSEATFIAASATLNANPAILNATPAAFQRRALFLARFVQTSRYPCIVYYSSI